MIETNKIYTGTHPRAIGNKKRLSLPSKLRKVFENASNKEDFVVIHNAGSNRLSILPIQHLSELFKVSNLREAAPHIRPFSLDQHGRFLLSDAHANFLGFPEKNNVIFTGNYDYFSVYAKDVWEKLQENVIT